MCVESLEGAMTNEQVEKRFSYRFFMIIGMMSGGFFLVVSEMAFGLLWPGCFLIGLFGILVIFLTFQDIDKIES